MKAVDFFCGAGGLTRGLSDSGFDVIAGIDVDENCKTTYENNNPKSKFLQEDIREMDIKDLKKLTGVSSFKKALFAACAPCQPFSQHLKEVGSKHDGTLLGDFGRLIEEGEPKYVLIENVQGITKVKGFSAFKRFIKLLDSMNYRHNYGVLNAKHFGVPQNRRRFILIASKFKDIKLPDKEYGEEEGLIPFKTVRDAISQFPVLRQGKEHSEVLNHKAASITEMNINRLKSTPKNGGDRRSWPEHLRLKCHLDDYEGHTDVYGRMRWNAPAPTLTARCHSISNGRYGHPTQNRAISLREAAALQSFPDNYEFHGSMRHIAQQIGNAVPVLLAKKLGEHILNS